MQESSIPPDKLSGAVLDSEIVKTLCSAADTQIRRSKDRQHVSGGIHQCAHVPSLAAGNCPETPVEVMQTPALHQSNVHPGGTEVCCGLLSHPFR